MVRWLLVVLVGLVGAAQGAPVLMISIDGLRPRDVIDAGARDSRLPVLTGLLRGGAYATAVRNSLPTITYPNHTTLITGVSPAQHGIADNLAFDPLRTNQEGWNWYASAIRVPTIWDVAHAAGLTVASISWPVSVGARSVDALIPEFWRAKTAEDLKLIEAVSTGGLIAELEQRSGCSLAAIISSQVTGDDPRVRFASALYTLKRPQLMTLHLISLDHVQHIYGPDSPQSKATLEKIDTLVGELLGVARNIFPDLVVVVVSDHGFASVDTITHLSIPFIEAGLITYDAKNQKVTSWEAQPWAEGGSAAVVLARPDDEVLKAKVRTLLDKLVADPRYGIDRYIERDEVAARGGGSNASFFIDCKIGVYAGNHLTGPVTTPSDQKGAHGYFPDHPEMNATLMISGPSVAKQALGEVDMRDIAPTVAKLLGLSMPTASGSARL